MSKSETNSRIVSSNTVKKPPIWFVIVCLAGFGWVSGSDVRGSEVSPRRGQELQDPLRLLPLAAVADDAEAERLRRQVQQLLPAWKRTATAADLARLAQLLAQTLRSPAEVRQVLGPPARVARQLIHRRYLEQWTYDEPCALCAVWDCPRGLPPRLVSVLVLEPEKK
jgi:hypothetical protein